MFRTFFCLLLIAAGPVLAADRSLADLPDPLVGTDSKYELSRGNTSPAVFVPFAMANWTAQTGEGGWPYQYAATSIRGFRYTHRPSAWMTDYGPFSLMPVSGELKVLAKQRAAAFRHQDEDARAYRYKVRFPESGTAVDMVPSRHGGMFGFTYSQTGKTYIVLDAEAGGSSVAIDRAARTVTGRNQHTSKGTAANFAVYFVIQFDRDFIEAGTWDDSGATDSAEARSGKHVGAWFAFDAKAGETLHARIGTSLISLDQARLNLKNEIGSTTLDALAARDKAEWERELARIAVQGGSEAEHRTFYTGLYHSFQFPRLLDEVDASGAVVHYSPYDGKVHPGPMFSDTGFWDTFRAEFPLFTVIQQKRLGEIIQAMLNIYDQTGWIPKWPNPAETNVMIGTHADSVIADAYLKGIRGFDAAKAYAAIRKDATIKGSGIFEARGGIEDYLRLGYVPSDIGVRESAARTLEYAYDDFCVAQLAHALGREDDFAKFTAQSRNYRNLYEPGSGFMRGRKSGGAWDEPFDPLAWGGVYTEGNAWQWLWSVQHDVPGLMQLMGGREAFLRKLDELFSTTNDFRVGGYGLVIHEMTEAKMANTGQYAHINEPCHHVIYLYNYAGQPWKAQQRARDIMDRFYRPGPSGWLGDEDNGQMSAWYIFSALGFYPSNPGQPVYALGSPLFDRASLKLENGKSFTVASRRTAASDVYVQSVTLNGKPLDRCWIRHEEIMAGGELSFVLGPKPNEKWGASGMPLPPQPAK